MKKSTSWLITLATLVGVISAAWVIGSIIDSARPNSTAGVQKVGSRSAVLPVGETLILTDKVGKGKQTWRISYDGQQTVHFRCSASCHDHTVKLCGIGCEVDTASGLIDHLYTTQRDTRSVTVRWPSSWDYRPHQK